MKIKNLKIKNQFFLAPMEEVNDIAFRLLCKKSGAALTYTGLTNPLTKQELILDDKPVLQLFCNTTKGIKEFMKKYEDKIAFWDFNLGCPAKSARKHKVGAYMAGDFVTIENILKVMKDNTKKPITIKIRKSKHANKLLKLAEKYCDAIAIHARTLPQGYGGEPDLIWADKFKQNSKIPVIYSGNVNENNAKNLKKDFDFLMIGREAIGRPNIFGKVNGNETKITFEDYLKLAKKYKLPFRQIKFQAMNFTKGKRDSRKLRLQIFETRKLEDLEKLSSLLN